MSVDTKAMEKVGITLHAKNLPNLHTFSVIDPFAVLYLFDKKRQQLIGSGHTEVIDDTRNPSWAKIFTLNYLFEEVQEVIIHVYHNTKRGDLMDVDKHELIGELRFPLANLMTARDQKLHAALVNSNKHGAALGEIEVRAEVASNTRDIFVSDFSAKKLANKEGFFSKSDPFMDFSRMNEDGTFTHVYRSPHLENTLDPHWGVQRIPMYSLCNGDLDRPIKIEVFDHERSGKHVSMGAVNSSVRSMLTSNGSPMPILEADKKDKKGYTNSGTLIAANTSIEYHPAFLHFVKSGLEISLNVAIDLTGSNGDPRDPSSLHYLDPSKTTWNVYQQMINAVTNILQQYDSDKKYAVFGFGARQAEEDGTYGPVQHCIRMDNGKEVNGIDGILEAYHNTLHQVMLSGPTLIAPIIQASTGIAAATGCTQERPKYNILLIITDGTINDMDATKQALVAASHQPMSVIIVGVGPADFKDMRVLDSDKERLNFAGQVAARDIVQFVAFTPGMSVGQLAEQVLQEIPDQVLQYMEQHHILPGRH